MSYDSYMQQYYSILSYMKQMDHEMERENNKDGIQGKTFVVTGGLGLVGANLCLELARRGATEVRSLDVKSSSPWSSLLSRAHVVLLVGDITNKEDVDKAVQGADCVFHIASYGKSGKESLQTSRIEKVNIEGTGLILDACVEFGAKRLIYVSTYNVVFKGEEIVNGDESLPYRPLDDHTDPYSCSKTKAEQLVLSYNSHPFRKKDGCLYSCAVRPAAVYGPGQEKTIARIVNYAMLRLLLFKIGDVRVKTDWVYVDNLIDSLILASMGLLHDNPSNANKHPTAAGQAYFISDGIPVNTFEFIQPLLKSLEYGVPRSSLTLPLALLFAKICRVFYIILYPFINLSWIPQPLILPAEVYQVGVTHYFSLRKAEKELRYVPRVSPQEGMEATISYWRDWKRKRVDSPSIYAWIFCVFGLSGLFVVNFFPDVGPVPFLKAIALFIFHSNRNLKIFSSIVAIAHSTEGIFAWFLARKVDPSNATGWFWQTLLLATFSLRLLLRRAGPRCELNSERLLSEYQPGS